MGKKSLIFKLLMFIVFAQDVRAGDDITITYVNHMATPIGIEYNEKSSECWYQQALPSMTTINPNSSSAAFKTQTKASGECFFKNGELALNLTVNGVNTTCVFKEDSGCAGLYVSTCNVVGYRVSPQNSNCGPDSGDVSIIFSSQ